MLPGGKSIDLTDLKRVTEASIHRAGPRYTPALDPNAPNLQITPLVETFDALTHSGAFKSRLTKLEAELREAWSRASASLRQALSETAASSALCSDLLRSLRTQAAGSGPQLQGELRKSYHNVRSALLEYEEQQDSERRKHEKGSKERNSFDYAIDEARRLRQPLEELGEFLSSTACSVIYNNKLFLRGSWGSGKTHLLCDIANERVKQGLPTLLILAQTLPTGADPLQAVFQTPDLGSDVEAALQRLDELGQQSGGRALILIDAINEGDRVAWHEHIEQVAALVSGYPNIGLVLSCRTPFDRQILTEAAVGRFVFATHVGFADIEFDAQTEFFQYYGIPNPHVPLLAPEFSSPLFLKILCKSIATLGQPAKKRRIKSFASGHKGMTKLLEDFVGEVGAGIEKDFGLQGKACWRILKGQGPTANAIGIAPRMAELLDDQISMTDTIDIVAEITGFENAKAKELIIRMTNEGLLSEDSRYIEDTRVDTVRLPYQRFSDHLISRHMLVLYLDTTSPATIRKCFQPSRPLGKLFKRSRWNGYEMPGLVSAMMLEFPERVKRAVHADRQELAFYLPKRDRTFDLSGPFIEGLLWRDVDSFSKQTNRLVNVFLTAPSRETQQAMLEALVSLASRPDHRYSAEKLRAYLLGMSLPERDLFWTEFLRDSAHSSAIYRVLDWVQQSGSANMDEATAKNLITLISLFLTSTRRPFRDRATRCLVLLGEQSPTSLFTEVSQSFAFSDPYVCERLLAAAYGVLMRQWAFPQAGLREAALPLALELRDRLVGTDDDAPIEHILMRESARGFIELTARLAPEIADKLLKDPRRISPKTVLRRPSRISEKSIKGADSAIRMDFGNYTMGRLVPGRANYDYEHKGYKAVRRQIERRIIDLGYDSERFKSVDRIIAESTFYARNSDEGQKTDRYGKKYSWIAFYEAAGRLALRGRLRDRWEDARISDTDIDPSFPSAPRDWRPPLSQLFGKPFTTPAEWLQHGVSPHYGNLLVLSSVDGQEGPWVLLDGYISEGTASDHRQTFTFLRSVLVRQRDIPRLHKAVKDTEYPGNRAIPEPIEEHYLFAGEIGWSEKFGYRRDGRLAGPDIGGAFERVETRRVTKRFGDLSDFEQMRLVGRFRFIIGEEAQPREEVEYTQNDLVDIDKYTRIPGVMVEVPLRHFAWESYHSAENQSGGADYPSPAIVRSLTLRKRGAQVDMFDTQGRLATMYRVSQTDSPDSKTALLYIRADLLEAYLLQRGMSLVWINWGEREMHHSVATHLGDEPKVRDIWGTHSHIHEEFFVYDPAVRMAKNRSL